MCGLLCGYHVNKQGRACYLSWPLDRHHFIITDITWWSGVVVSTLALINEVNQARARLVLSWVTVSGFNSRCGTVISVCNQPPKSTQPGHHIVGRCNEYQPKGGDTVQLGSKGSYDLCVGGR